MSEALDPGDSSVTPRGAELIAGRLDVRSIPRVRPVMQALLAAKETSLEKRTEARNTVLKWADQRWPGILDESAFRGDDFEYDQPGLKLTSLSLDGEDLWCFRVEHQDSSPSQSRNWVIESLVSRVESGDVVGVKTQCSTTSARDVPATSPRFLRTWLEHYQLYDGPWPVSGRTIIVRSGIGVSRLVELVQSTQRALPVVVFAEDASGGIGAQANRVMRRVCGLAHVVLISGDQAQYLSELAGKDGAISTGDVRTYLPGFGTLNDSQVHALVERHRIQAWKGHEGGGAGAFHDALVSQLHKYSVASPEKLEQMPNTVSIRRCKAERERDRQFAELASLRSKVDQDSQITTRDLRLSLEEQLLEVQILKEEITETKRKQDEWMEVAQDRDAAAQAMGQTVEALRAQNANLYAAVQRYREGGHFQVPIPQTLDYLSEWIDEHYADRMILLPRAKRAAKASAFLDVPLIFRSLQLLAVEYWNLRTAEPTTFSAAQLAFQSKMQSLEVDEAASISASRVGEFEEAYKVKYAAGGKSTQTLDRHIRGGSNTKDDRYCLRIYFFWDDEAERVVIGHLPGHLDTRAT